MRNTFTKPFDSKQKISNDNIFEILTESQMKDVLGDVRSNLSLNNGSGEKDYESISQIGAKNDLIAESTSPKQRNGQCNWVISANQCNIRYSPFYKSARVDKKNQMMRSFCHGLVDMFFSQKDEISSLKYEIIKLGKAIQGSKSYYSPSSKRRSHSKTFTRRKENVNLSIVEGAKMQINNNNKEEPKSNQLLLQKNERQTKKERNNKESGNNYLPKANANSVQDKNENNNNEKAKAKEKEIERENKEEAINLSIIIDDEFDNMLTDLKNKKKGSIPNQNNPFRKSMTFIDIGIDKEIKSKKASLDNMNQVNNASFQSDFMCGGKPISYQPNAKTMKLLKELEENPETEDIVEAEGKESKEVVIASKKKQKKRNYIESTNHLPPQNLSPKLNKKKQFKHGFKVERATKDKTAIQPKLPSLVTSFDSKTISQCGYICLCEGLNRNCNICNGSFLITNTNFHIGFYESQPYKDSQLNDHTLRQLIISSSSSSSLTENEIQDEKKNQFVSFFKHQYRFLSWKQYTLDLIQGADPKNYFSKKSLTKIYGLLARKYRAILIEGKRSFLMKVSEKDASINVNMVLLVLDISYEDSKNYTLDLSDGYKSVFSVIEPKNPIHSLIEKKRIYSGMKLNIGLAKITKITEDFEVFISIHYNSIAPAKWNSKLGPSKETKYLIKNLSNLLTEGGQISMINVVILKKYDYYITDLDTKESYSKTKYEKMIQDNYEDYDNEAMQCKDKSKAISDKTKPKLMKLANLNSNLLYHFRIICVDALVYYDYMNKSPKYKTNASISNSNLVKKLQGRKCIIDFAVKNIGLFDEFVSGNIYRLMLLNMNYNSSFYKYTSSPSELRLKAGDSIRLIEEKYPSDFRKDKQYHDMVNRLSMKIIKTAFDVCDFFVKMNLVHDSMFNEEYSFIGCYLHKSVITYQKIKEDTKEVCHLFFGSSTEICVLIKIHNMNYFDLELFKSLNSKKEFKVFQWENVKFEQACYYDKEMNKLLPLRADKEKRDTRNIVLCLETHYYSKYKPISISSIRDDNKDSVKKVEWDKIFKEETINNISCCL